MVNLMAVVKTFLTEDEWPYQELENQMLVRTQFQGDNAQWVCFAQTNEEMQQFIFYSICPINIAENKRKAMAEFLTRANYGLLMGNFEMDFEDGQVRYKTSLDVEGETLTPGLVKNVIYANVTLMDRYMPGIMKVNYTEVEPADVIAQIEN
jgi:hypothetical protein